MDKTDEQIMFNRESKLKIGEKIAENEIFNIHSFNKKHITITKPISVGFPVLPLPKILRYGWYYGETKLYFVGDNLKTHYKGNDSKNFHLNQLRDYLKN